MRVVGNKKLLYALLGIAIIATLSINIYYIYTIKSEADSYFSISSKIDRLKSADIVFDEHMSKTMNFFNYDKILEAQREFEKNLEEIESLFLESENREIFKELKEGYQSKKELLLRFASYNAIINNSIRYSSKVYNHIENDTFASEISNIYIEILHFGLGLDENKMDILEKIDSYKKEDEKSVSQNFLRHLEIIIKYHNALEENKKLSEDIALRSKIDNLSLIYYGQYNENITTLYMVFYFLFFMLALFVVLVSFLLYSRAKAEQELKQFKKAVEGSDNSVVLTNPEHKIVYVNEAFTKITGYTLEEVKGSSPRKIQSGQHTQGFYDEINTKIHKGYKWSGEFVNRTKSGELQYEKATIMPIYNDFGKIKNYLAIKLDITQDRNYQKKIEEQRNEIEKKHYIDDLTGRGNRHHLIRNLENNKKSVIIYININSFNDMKYFYGIDNTDEMIRSFSLYLGEIAAEIFVDRIYRIQGDEFCLEIINRVDVADDKATIIKIHNKLEAFIFWIDSQMVSLSLTIGVSSDRDVYFDNIKYNRYIQAEMAHRMARENKRSFWVFDKNSTTHKEYKHNMLISRKLKDAIEGDRIFAFFQPIYSTKTEKPSYYEALVRIADVDGSILSPAQFLDIAKKTSLYHDVTKSMLKHVFKTIIEEGISVSINLSSLDFEESSTIMFIKNFIKEYHAPQNLIFEIVESESIENFALIEEFISEVKEFGCKIAIDDFGSGYSSYARVARLNIDYIKIDGSLIHDIDTNEKSEAVVRSIITFAKSLDFKVVAEFVKDESIYKKIKELGIEYAQGFYLGKPQLLIE